MVWAQFGAGVRKKCGGNRRGRLRGGEGPRGTGRRPRGAFERSGRSSRTGRSWDSEAGGHGEPADSFAERGDPMRETFVCIDVQSELEWISDKEFWEW